uniref:Galectin n=1 Tax=Scophthalmus maximus TaxID=52904 RepID=A0A8D3CIW7_SCOMX
LTETSSVCFLQKWTVPQRSGTDGRKPGVGSPEAQRSLVVPFRGLIPGGLRPGKKVVVVGVVDSRPDRFYVALTCGRGTSREPPPDVALELCVRFGDRQVLRRACVSGSWGDVDRAVPFFPFIRDQPFKVQMICFHSAQRQYVHIFDVYHESDPPLSPADGDPLRTKSVPCVCGRTEAV